MTIRKTLTLLALPALLFSGQAAAGAPEPTASASHQHEAEPGARAFHCTPYKCCILAICKLATNGPELTGLQPAAARATITAVRLPAGRDPNGIGGSCPPFACGSDGNSPARTGSRAVSGPATVTAIQLPAARDLREIGGSCPPFMCGSDGNGPSLTGMRARSDATPVGEGRLRPQELPGPSAMWCWQVTDWWEVCW